MIRPIKPKDLTNFIYYCQSCKNHNDFYITKDNKRLFLNDIKNIKSVFYDCLKWGNKCYIKEENDIIKAVLLVVGYKDKFERKFVKILSQEKKDFQDLFNYLDWQELKNLFIKVNIQNKNFVKYDLKIKRFKPSYILRKSGFQIIAIRKSEVLLKKEETNRGYYKHNIKRN